MSGSGEYTTTPNLGLFKPTYNADAELWGDHLNLNADTLDAAIGAGGPFLPINGSVAMTGQLYASASLVVTGSLTLTGEMQATASHTQPTADYIYHELDNTVVYTADGTNGDSLGLVSYMFVEAGGHTVPNTASQHTCAIYGNGSLVDAGTVYQVIGVMGVSGNSGAGTLTNGVDFFGHTNYKTGGGTIVNHYFLYQEPSSAATHEYGAYFSAPIGIGTTLPTYNIQLNSSAGGNVLAGNWMQLGSTQGQFTVTSGGASFYPGYNPGAGGLGVLDLVVGNNGTANATGATGGFLYISACAGTPTGGPAQAAPGRIAVTYDTTAHKLWMHDGTSWRGVVLT